MMLKQRPRHWSRWHRLCISTLIAVLLAFVATTIALGQEEECEWEREECSWAIGKLQLLTGTSSGPLRITKSATSLSSYRFVGKVGGVAFDAVAVPGRILASKELTPQYTPANPDGQRLAITIAGKQYVQPVPDWILVPVAKFADSQYNSVISLFGEQTNDQYYDIVYHEAFHNTLIGMRLLQADMLFFDLNETWRLPAVNGHVVLGAGETPPERLDRASAVKINGTLGNARFQSWVFTDDGETVKAALVDGTIKLSGRPYYYFWNSDFQRYEREVNRLSLQADAFRKKGNIREHNRIIETINGLEPRVEAVSGPTTALREQWATVRNFNPAVYDATTRVMQFAALFRYIKARNPKGWDEFLHSLDSVQIHPRVSTPTKWKNP